jgi:hypothetical protein
LLLALARFPEEKWAKASRTGAKVAIQMRFSNPLLLASFGVLFVAASCTLITDVDRSKIPDGVAGTLSDAGSPSQPQGGDTNGGTAPVTMGGSESMGGTDNTPAGGGGAAGDMPTAGGGGVGGMVDVGGAGAGGQTPVDPTAGAAGTVP